MMTTESISSKRPVLRTTDAFAFLLKRNIFNIPTVANKQSHPTRDVDRRFDRCHVTTHHIRRSIERVDGALWPKNHWRLEDRLSTGRLKIKKVAYYHYKHG